mmetsp:Transcript_18276/g.22407  ORF Transcript_18276/g.22407 Transcript_18276/m.22407 type:complete len:193 (+) Transcript_18276:553-1131(+)|eukprot:CAMPEP_0204845414 /NCGR_PEP_ID=MMETSP1347-20130617/1151_1 /ASSEMBLY_ACC=CAM_ASM_000690 /TAXON_ID=215587 /ORGANISM="Aplanochytrium stocchinoi, Strain GSBS06" /LENGTH=192 /DNA_ID=CAMNT_0051985471 /DNA_START=44 /DNA_END=622 /DNA_ORIENTATION=+
MTDLQEAPRVWFVQLRIRKRTGTDNVVKEEWGDVALTWRDSGRKSKNMQTNMNIINRDDRNLSMILTADMNRETHVLHTWSTGDIKQLVHEPGNKVFAVVIASGEVYVFRSKTLHQRESIIQCFEQLIQAENSKCSASDKGFNNEIKVSILDEERFPYHGTVHLSQISDIKTAGKFNKVYTVSENTVRVDRS